MPAPQSNKRAVRPKRSFAAARASDESINTRLQQENNRKSQEKFLRWFLRVLVFLLILGCIAFVIYFVQESG